MIKKIPNKIKIGGHWWRVIEVDKDILGGEDCFGDQDASKLLIRIRKDMDNGQKLATFIHEVLHCVNLEWEEERVEFLAQALFQIIKENKLIK